MAAEAKGRDTTNAFSRPQAASARQEERIRKLAARQDYQQSKAKEKGDAEKLAEIAYARRKANERKL
jgi:hypothetical protein